MRIKFGAVLAVVLGSLGLGVPTASATFHLMQVREVYPGSVASPESEYVELQMWAAGQNLVGGHVLHLYGPTGTETGNATFAQNVPNSVNQSTLVLATPQAAAQFTIAPDASLPAGDKLSPSGGAVCWENIDCVSWGSFSGALNSPAGSPVASGGIPDGLAIRRTIEPGCATLLEQGDDHDNSAADFFLASPSPRPNSVSPTERPCRIGTPPEDPPNTHGPETVLRKTPAKRTRDRTPTFRFGASEQRVTFQCRVDARPFQTCRSPYTTKPLRPGHHRFRVRATDAEGNPDLTPANYSFTVLR